MLIMVKYSTHGRHKINIINPGEHEYFNMWHTHPTSIYGKTNFVWVLHLFLCSSFQWLVIPFALHHPSVTSLTETTSGPDSWIGELRGDWSLSFYLDLFFTGIIGGLPFQVIIEHTVLCFLKIWLRFLCKLGIQMLHDIESSIWSSSCLFN